MMLLNEKSSLDKSIKSQFWVGHTRNVFLLCVLQMLELTENYTPEISDYKVNVLIPDFQYKLILGQNNHLLIIVPS